MGNLNHLPFGMILSLDIGFLKKFRRPIKGQIEKKKFYNFFGFIWSNGLENSAKDFSLTFKAIKTKKTTQRLNFRKSRIWKRRTQILPA